jgi:transposase-like protein
MPKKTGSSYPEEFKARALQQVHSSPEKSVSQLANELGIAEQTLRNWINQEEEEKGVLRKKAEAFLEKLLPGRHRWLETRTHLRSAWTDSLSLFREHPISMFATCLAMTLFVVAIILRYQEADGDSATPGAYQQSAWAAVGVVFLVGALIFRFVFGSRSRLLHQVAGVIGVMALAIAEIIRYQGAAQWAAVGVVLLVGALIFRFAFSR